MLSSRARVALSLVALFGLAGPNGVFLYYLAVHWNETWATLRHPAALAFVVEAFVVMGLVAVYVAHRPLGNGRFGWQSFVALSLLGGLAFSLPTFYLLNSPKAGAAGS
jgi:hypothetical protein